MSPDSPEEGRGDGTEHCSQKEKKKSLGEGRQLSKELKKIKFLLMAIH